MHWQIALLGMGIAIINEGIFVRERGGDDFKHFHDLSRVAHLLGKGNFF